MQHEMLHTYSIPRKDDRHHGDAIEVCRSKKSRAQKRTEMRGIALCVIARHAPPGAAARPRGVPLRQAAEQ